jgi:DNA-binding NarL/FixJ family response regulator
LLLFTKELRILPMNILKHLEEIIDNYKVSVSSNNSECIQLLNHLKNEIVSFKGENTCTSVNLTKREVEVLSIVSKGFTNKEVASALDLSSKTIEFHLKNIYLKLQVSGRSEAISYAISNGYI